MDKIMDYMTAPQTAKKWEISVRRVQKLCEENRVDGAERMGNMWLIPKDTKKPLDGRLKTNRKNGDELD